MKGFTSGHPHGAKNKTDIWITPKWIIDSLGGWKTFDLDPCGYKGKDGVIVETAKEYFFEEDNGLILSWKGRAFVNFPYSQSNIWLKKSQEHGNTIVLCFARTDTNAWQQNVKLATGINFIKGRIKFLDSTGKERTNGNAASCLIAFGEDNFQLITRIEGIHVRVC